MPLHFFKYEAGEYDQCASEYQTSGCYHIPGVFCCKGARLVAMPARLTYQEETDTMFVIEEAAEAQCETCATVYNVARIHVQRNKSLRS